MMEAICKIKFERIEDKQLIEGRGLGFFCEINIEDFPMKYCLFTNNHVLNETNIKKNEIINFEKFDGSKYLEQKIKIDDKRKFYTNKELDYTCIEILESDNIKKYFKIDPSLIESDKIQNLKDNDIFILHYPYGNDLSFSYGKILFINENYIRHNASTDDDSSGSPIFSRRSNDNYIIGLHYGGNKDYLDINATNFISILKDISKGNEIYCIYNGENMREIEILHNYKEDVKNWPEDIKKFYLEAKEINTKIFRKNTELYLNGKKIEFDYKIKVNNSSKEIKVKFKFTTNLTNISFMFYNCSSLQSINLSSLNSSNIINMSHMFSGCSSLQSINLSSFDKTNLTDISHMFFMCFSLKSIDLSSFNTTNVTNMSNMFDNCSSLKSIDLSSFNTTNVINMSNMFFNCNSLQSLDLSSFNTTNVTNMSHMFFSCSSLISIDLSSFNTANVTNMSYMFSHCSSLQSLDLSSFNTTNVTYMDDMFCFCSSLQSLDLSSFNTTNVTNMYEIFLHCYDLKKENIKIKNRKDKILNEK